MLETKTWVVKLEIMIDANSHPRKFIPETISEALNFEMGEDLTHYEFICLD
jgi:hypothetical protein